MNKSARYQRLHEQISNLLTKSGDVTARMATICAVLHHKMPQFFWTGFYLLRDGRLTVSVYQGPVACMELEKDKGVCWAGINSGRAVIVPDVHQFPGHIACDSRSRSEIVIPVRNLEGTIIGVLDIDSTSVDSFDDLDAMWLDKIVSLIF